MEPSQPQIRLRRSHLPQLFISIALLSAALLLVVYKQFIIDNITYWTFKPAPAVARLASSTTMSSRGKFYFYAARPQIDERDAFNADCHNTSVEQTIILGCYSMQRVYVFDVTDSRLNGIKEVTAAHEMLHVAYARLSTSQRSYVDGLINQQLKSVTDTRVQKLIDVYAKTEPGEKLNELHSIFGTELSNLSPELEKYYAQYFTNRQTVVAMANSYQSVFDGLQNQQSALVNELNNLADTINSQEKSYASDAAQLNVDITDFNARAKSGDMSPAQFSSQRASLTARQTTLQQNYDSLSALIAQYNLKRQDLESINSQANELNHSIDSTLSPVPSL